MYKEVLKSIERLLDKVDACNQLRCLIISKNIEDILLKGDKRKFNLGKYPYVVSENVPKDYIGISTRDCSEAYLSASVTDTKVYTKCLICGQIRFEDD